MKIRVEHITKTVLLQSHEHLTILQDISLNIESGEILGIIGVSGSGKSTLLGLLAGLDLPSQGNIYWDTVNLKELNEDKRASLRLKTVGFIFQNFELLPAYTALENVMLPLELSEHTHSKERAMAALERVGLKHRISHYPNQLSGGEQQRVAIARAFAIEPKILFADEPTGSLDEKTSQEIAQLLVDINREKKTTLVCVTHDRSLTQICSRTLYLSGGHLHREV